MKHFLLLSLLSLSSFCITAMEVVPCSGKDNVRLLHDGKRTFVEDENAAYRIENYDMNPLMRKLVDRGILNDFTKRDGYVRVTKQEGHDQAGRLKYALAAKVRGNGGTGPITAFTVGMIVRVGCYTGILTAISTAATVGSLAGPGGTAAAGGATMLAIGGTAGGAAGVVAGVEALALKATLATLLIPFPLP